MVVNVAHEQLKFHGVGGASGPSGVLVYHNTFVSPATALVPRDIGDEPLLRRSPTTSSSDPRARPDASPTGSDRSTTARFDYDGYFPDGAFRFNLPPDGLVDFASFAALQAGGLEGNGVLLAQPIFANGLVPPADYTVDAGARRT